MRDKAEGRIIYKLFRGSMRVMILAFGMATLSMLIDGIIVGRYLGSVSMAALGVCLPIFLMVSSLGGALSEGAQPVCNKFMAAGKTKEANSSFCLASFLQI